MYRLILLGMFVVSSWLHSYEYLDEGIYIERNQQEGYPGPRIAILTVITDGEDMDVGEKFQRKTYAEMVAFGTRSKEVYAKLHGYDLIKATKKLDTCYGTPSSRPLEAAWTKLALISRFLKHYDWVFWTDADSVILNFDVRLEMFLDEAYDLIGCDIDQNATWQGQMRLGQYLNTGEVFYKNSDITAFVVKSAWENHHEETPWSWEQARINHFLQENKLNDHVYVYPQKAFNVCPELYEPGNFLIHLYSYHGRSLFKKFRELEKKYRYLVDEAEGRLSE